MPAMRLVSRVVTDFYTKSAFCNLIADTARPCGKCGSFNVCNYTKGKFCIIEGSLTGSRPSATPSISEYSKNRAHIVRSGRAIFLRCLQNLRFVWLRLGFGFCAVRLGLSWCCASFRLLPFFLVWFMPPPRPRATAAGAPFRF